MGPSLASLLTEGLWCHKSWWAACHCHGNHWARTSQMEGNSTSSVPTCSLQKDGSSPERVSGSTRWFKNCFPGMHSLQSHVERKYGIDKTHAPRSLNRKSMDGGGRTTYEHPFPWEEASPGKETMEYLLTHFPPLGHCRRYRDHTKAFKPVSSREQGL